MNLVQQHCHGYSTGCVCPMCSARSDGVKSDELFYDRHSQLRWKGSEHLTNGRAVAAYMRERDRQRRALLHAA